MWTGRPDATASAAKMRRKSCGVNRTATPSGWVNLLAVTIRFTRLNAADGVIMTLTSLHTRWNRNGNGGLWSRSAWS